MITRKKQSKILRFLIQTMCKNDYHNKRKKVYVKNIKQIFFVLNAQN